MKFNSSNETEFTGHMRIKTKNIQFLQFPNCYFREGFATIPYLDFTHEDLDAHFRFYGGATTDPESEIFLSITLLIMKIQPDMKFEANVFDTSGADDNGDEFRIFGRSAKEIMRLCLKHWLMVHMK